MTSVAAIRIPGVGTTRGRPATSPIGHDVAPLRFGYSIPWNEPAPWTVILVGVLLTILGAHDRIARAIGTAEPSTGQASTVSTMAPAAAPPVNLTATSALAPSQPVAPLPTHAPRDPFRALVSPTGAQLPVVTLPTTKGHSVAPPPRSKPVASGPTPTCTAVHVVSAGESLWSIAAQHVTQTGHGNVNAYWHHIYAANTSAIGSNPSQLDVGVKLCLPQS